MSAPRPSGSDLPRGMKPGPAVTQRPQRRRLFGRQRSSERRGACSGQPETTVPNIPAHVADLDLPARGGERAGADPSGDQDPAYPSTPYPEPEVRPHCGLCVWLRHQVVNRCVARARCHVHNISRSWFTVLVSTLLSMCSQYIYGIRFIGIFDISIYRYLKICIGNYTIWIQHRNRE